MLKRVYQIEGFTLKSYKINYECDQRRGSSCLLALSYGEAKSEFKQIAVFLSVGCLHYRFELVEIILGKMEVKQILVK